MSWLGKVSKSILQKLDNEEAKVIASIEKSRELNNYTGFTLIEESRAFGKRLNGDWLCDFQEDGKFHNWFLSDFDSYNRIKIEKVNKIQKDFFEKHYSCNFDTKYHECEIYEVFRFYCGNVYDQINRFCRNGFFRWRGEYNCYKNYTENERLKLSKMVNTMCNEILRFKLDDNIITYRVLEYNDLLQCKNFKKIKKGDIITHKGFLSTGLVLNSLLKEHPNYDTILKLYVPIGCNALYVDILDTPHNEQELLLLPNTELEIISKKVFRWFSGGKRLIVCKVNPKNIKDIKDI